jgi:hypothetical protein
MEDSVSARDGSRGLVLNIRTGARYDVYIGRGSVWGNPYSHKKGTQALYVVNTRQEAIERYEEWIRTQPDLLAQVHLLKGLRLGCWCRPLSCHGDILLKLANGNCNI